MTRKRKASPALFMPHGVPVLDRASLRGMGKLLSPVVRNWVLRCLMVESLSSRKEMSEGQGPWLMNGVLPLRRHEKAGGGLEMKWQVGGALRRLAGCAGEGSLAREWTKASSNANEGRDVSPCTVHVT